MTKKYSLEADKLDKWLAQLRDPKSRQTFKRYFDCSQLESASDYILRVRREGRPVCGCALGHFAAATIENPANDVFFHLDADLDPRIVDAVFHLNDVEQKSLPEIADWLEANVERV